MPASAGGVSIECPGCGRNLRVPLAAPLDSETDADVATLEKLTGRRFRAETPPDLRPLATLALALTGILALCGLLVFEHFWPNGLVLTGAGLAWWLALWLAQLGCAGVTRNLPARSTRRTG